MASKDSPVAPTRLEIPYTGTSACLFPAGLYRLSVENAPPWVLLENEPILSQDIMDLGIHKICQDSIFMSERIHIVTCF